MNARKRDLVGRKIVTVEFHRQHDKDRSKWFHSPVLTLDNGRRVWFATQETDTGEYGTAICISDPKADKAGA